jgi:CO/xanthine dehydrogenase FAD-binding subunit
LHIDTSTTLNQLIADQELQRFADGVVVNAITEGVTADYHEQTIGELLLRESPAGHGLLTTLLILDAEINATINDETRVFPLAAFLNYRTRLQDVPLTTLRCPPLNQDGHYLFSVTEENNYLAIRLDLHPTLRVAGHVRIATGGNHRLPQRLRRVEHRLDRQVLYHSQLEAALASKNLQQVVPPLSTTERERLATLLGQLVRT